MQIEIYFLGKASRNEIFILECIAKFGDFCPISTTFPTNNLRFI